jgi:hypothetical protein
MKVAYSGGGSKSSIRKKHNAMLVIGILPAEYGR